MSPINDTVTRVANDVRFLFNAQQRLYFCPLPQGHGSLRPIADINAPPESE
jgi:hypothetical protein